MRTFSGPCADASAEHKRGRIATVRTASIVSNPANCLTLEGTLGPRPAPHLSRDRPLEEFLQGCAVVFPDPAGGERAGSPTGAGAEHIAVRTFGNENRADGGRPDLRGLRGADSGAAPPCAERDQ